MYATFRALGVRLAFAGAAFFLLRGAAAAEAPDYNRDIRPILSKNCYACHGPDAEQRKAGLRLDNDEGAKAALRSGAHAIVPGDRAASALYARIASTDPDELMPPPDTGNTLTQDEIDLLGRWIDSGAEWANHWAFEPVSLPPVPENGAAHPIDAFVLDTLAEQGLTPSPEADRRTLIRRLYFDLHGLPPSLEAIRAFEEDSAPDAYEKLVDELLASPRYGERWARHWLDTARYGDTHGYDKDKRRPNGWPYRDYVIRALNDDKPYGEFAAEQIAGDVLAPEDPEGVVATGFLAAGPWDFVGHVELREGTKDKKITRVLDRDDVVSGVMNTFASVTVQCARCHDHKFDPIPTAEYYGLQAVFAGVERADRAYGPDAETHARRAALEREARAMKRRTAELDAARAAVATQETQRIDAELAALREDIAALGPDAVKSPSNGYHSGIEAKADAEKWVEIDLGSAIPIDAVRLIPARPVDFPDTPGFGFPVRFRVTLSAESGGEGKGFDYTGEDYLNPGDEAVVIETGGAEARFVRVTATKLWERTNDFVFALAEAQVESGGANAALGAAVTAADTIDAGLWNALFLVDGYDSRKRLDAAEGLEVQLRGALRAAERELERARDDAVEHALGVEAASERNRVRRALRRAERELAALPAPHKVYAAAPDFSPEGSFTPPGGPREVFVLNRGDVEQPLEPARPGGLSLGRGADAAFALDAPDDEGARRAALARWIAAPENPLTWRSIVNRVWHYHFGRGIVETPNDFGAMGAPPTHPELLDWLAAEFLANGQSLKWLHKTIVTSAAYRQVSDHHEANAEVDASNRYLWRMNRRALDAESLRDGLLSLSGTLDLTMGGPGFDTFVFEDDHSPRYRYAEFDPDDPTARRRAVYRFIARSVPDPFLQTLDCADPSSSVPVRNETMTALQALAVLNNAFTVRQAEAFAEHVSGIAQGTGARVRIAYESATGRAPSDEDAAALRAYAAEHGLANACRVILNSNAFLFVD
jgi:mono/diheme cytochrome c family protein